MQHKKGWVFSPGVIVQARLQEAGCGCDLWRDGASDQPAAGAGL